LEMPKDELPNHNCIKHLRSVVQQQQTRIAELEKTSAEHKHQLAEQVGPGMPGSGWEGTGMGVWIPKSWKKLGEKWLREGVGVWGWAGGCRSARIGLGRDRNGGLGTKILEKIGGCPASITNELIENAHERNWPQGLATLETRQMNRRYYENYVAKRIPGKQAVVVMACENQHMGEDMVLEPGLVMIFAHGVEEI
ncbi:RNF41 ligase, partial [Certhia brachydactyla]|nr:RNF41 ligase [Certhia brachydactyla]